MPPLCIHQVFCAIWLQNGQAVLASLIAEPPLELEDRESLIRIQFLITFGRGLKLFRAQALSWRWKPAPLTERGMVKDEPVKANDDCNDRTRMRTAGWGPDVEPMTREEEIDRADVARKPAARSDQRLAVQRRA